MWRWILSTFFVITFCMGISFITLPFIASLAGFWPSLIILLFAWIYLLITSHYYLEATFSMPDGANVYSISKKYTRGIGTWLNSICFFLVNMIDILFFFYFGIPILGELLYRAHFPLPELLSFLTFGVILAGTVSLGIKWTMIVNFFLACVLCLLFYIAFASEIEMAVPREFHFKLGFLIVIVPSMLNALYFQTMIPTLATFLNRNIKLIKSVIISGLTITCLIFALWLWIVISTASAGFQQLAQTDISMLSFSHLSNVPFFGKWLPFLVLIGVITTILGSTTLLLDFIADIFTIPPEKRKGSRRALIAFCILIPSLFAPAIFNNFLIKFLRAISDIGSLYLCGLMPIWWIWTLRYEYSENLNTRLSTGRGLLICLTALTFFILYLVGLQIVYENAG